MKMLMKAKEMNRVLYADLTKKDIRVEERGDLFDAYLGGSGVAIKLLEEECPKGIDPLSASNPIIFAVGPLTALYPSASKTVAMFKSPLTGNLGESHTGGRSAMAIKLAGYGAIVIKGSSDIPLYLAIHGDEVKFKDASSIWGIEAVAVGRILREVETGAGVRTIIRIGRAGEKQVRYACAVCETYRHFGRLGLGAVMGSKKLKAVVISADKSIEIPKEKRKEYKLVYDEIQDVVVETDAMEKYHDLGTAGKIYDMNKLGGMAYKNLESASAPEEIAREFSGENIAQKYLSRRVSCAHCPVGCIHLASLRELYEPGYYFKTSIIPYDNETIYALGFMLGMKSAEDYLRLIDVVDKIGMDAISTGVTLAWATEAYERGIITKEHTEGLELHWGDVQAYSEAIEKIVAMPNEFYQNMAMGVEHASSVYGGQDYALAFGGNEMPEYHTGIACYLNNLTGARHSHLDSAGYDLDQKLIGKEFTLEEVVRALLKEEEWRQILSSLVVCFFARKVYSAERVINALDAIGIENWTAEKLEDLGRVIHRAKMDFKFREGFDLAKLRIPKRIFEVPTPHGLLKEEDVRKAIEIYGEMIL
ncbi:MAG: aldehyde ferredoxin oxidoreductase N-terminal domain-containing protein [Euryarchaeota archaeon]|nr:aldehyde ferredoxin oxidoreductase N-terminal domain-containing protein [Euryarchaeota archaeon]